MSLITRIDQTDSCRLLTTTHVPEKLANGLIWSVACGLPLTAKHVLLHWPCARCVVVQQVRNGQEKERIKGNQSIVHTPPPLQRLSPHPIGMLSSNQAKGRTG